MNKLNKSIVALFSLSTLLLAYGDENLIAFQYVGYDIAKEAEFQNLERSLKPPENQADLQKQLFFWSKRILLDVYYVEKNAVQGDTSALNNNIGRLSSDLKTMKSAPDSDILFRSCYPTVLNGLSRMLDRGIGGKEVITDEALKKALAIELLDSDQLKYLRTYASMLILGQKIATFKLSQGRLPSTLKELPETENDVFDAWKQAIEYKESEGHWSLLSRAGNRDLFYTAEKFIPSFSNKKTLVYSDQFTAMRKKLWQQGVWAIPPEFIITLNKKTGTMTTTEDKRD